MIRSIIAGAIAMTLVAPVAAAAQVTVDDTEAERIRMAEEISRQGYLLAEQRADFEAAANFLRSAATVRGEAQATVRDLLNAGHFNVYAQRSLTAASAFNAAGELALELGDRSTAARAFRFAAHAADRVGDAQSAMRFSARSEAVSSDAAVAVAAVMDR